MVLKNPDEYQKGKTIVYFVRHGESTQVTNLANSNDFGLSKLGKKQASEVASKLKRIKSEIDVLYSSTLKRAVETAEIIGKQIKKKPIQIKELSEFNRILWSNRIYHPRFWRHYQKHKASVVALDKILKNHKGKVIVIIAHGNIIKGIVGNKLKMSRNQIGKFDYHNCHISLLRFDGTKLDYIHYFNSKELVR
mgnify:CR=1 FL=1